MNGYSFYLSKTSVADETDYKIYLKSDTILSKGFPPYPKISTQVLVHKIS